MPPAASGFALCRHAHRDPDRLTSGDVRGRAMEAGGHAVLNKPFNPAELMRELAPHLLIQPGDRARLEDILASDRGLLLRDGAVARAEARAY